MFVKKLLLLLLLSIVLLVPGWSTGRFDHFVAMYDRFWDYSELGDLGFDCVYGNIQAAQDMDAALRKWENRSIEASASGMEYICGPYYQSGVAPIEYTRAVNSHGSRDAKAASPVDERYWNYAMEDVGLAIAELSLRCPVSGIVWDIEHYGSDSFEDWDYTYDSRAISLFSNQSGHNIPDLGAGERHDWLRGRGIVEEYEAWQEETVHNLAERTRNRIHAINPNLSLGILGFEDDCWLHLSILRGFSTPEVTVSAWHEDTFWGGYKRSKIDGNHQDFARLGINGRVIPGFWTYELDPYQLLFNMEYALRYNGTFWIYQHGRAPWALGTKDDYREAYRLLKDHICPNEPRFLPSFYMYPGVEIRPWLVDGGASAIVNSAIGATDMGLAFSNLELSPMVSDYRYVGEDMSTIVPRNNTIPLEQDGFIYGLKPEDLEATRAWGTIHELEDLLTILEELDLEIPVSILESVEDLHMIFEEGRYERAGDKANLSLDEAYLLAFEEIWPMVEAALGNPRNSTIPLIIMNKVNIAKGCMDRGEHGKGRMYLLKALNDWTEIPESQLGGVVFSLGLLALSLRNRRLHQRRKDLATAG